MPLLEMRWHWFVLVVSLLALTVVPFYFFNSPIEAWTASLLGGSVSTGAVAATVVGLLAADLILPIPSSVVATGAGWSLGFLGGLATIAIGMTAGSFIGYLLGRFAAEPILRRFIPRHEFEEVEGHIRAKGLWVVAICRSLPVLAESSAVVAGSFGMPLGSFLIVSALSNLGIAAVYALLGSLAMQNGSLPLAFASSVLTPLLAIAVVKVLRVFGRAGERRLLKDAALDNVLRGTYPGHH
jgi:uncharacterized membrane protein YdjX (TVP38/TMEM64 family)